MDIGRKRNPDIGLYDLQSEFDYQSEIERKKKKRHDFTEKEYPGAPEKLKRSDAKKWFQEEHGRMHRQMGRLMKRSAYDRHKEMMNLYHLCYQGATKKLERDSSKDRTDYDVLKDNHKFLWTAEELASAQSSYANRLAKRYYDKLFKEYCIVDLSRHKTGQIAMRWRVEGEVKSGKGHVICGVRKCEERLSLTSWEVNFAYVEGGQQKNALVKVRLCPPCSEMLNYRSKKKRVVKIGKSDKKKKDKKKRKHDGASSQSDSENSGATDANEATKEPSSSKKSGSTAVWEGPVPQEVTKTIDDDIDDFLNDVFD